MNREYSWKKTQIEKNSKKKKISALQHVRADFRSMTGEDRQPFHNGGPYYIEPSLFIYRAIQWIGFDFYKI